jgi:hypothetical protein
MRDAMAKERAPEIQVGDVVYHTTQEDRIAGVVIAVRMVLVDFGPEHGESYHPESALTDRYRPNFGES